MKPNESVGFPELHTQHRITNRLLAAQLRTSMSQQDMVKLLWSTGATSGEIADVLDTTAATVRTALQRLKKKQTARQQETSADATESADE
jgi:DNA-binding CsgD family transcriptional regulator